MNSIYRICLVFLMSVVTFSCGDDLVEKAIFDPNGITLSTVSDMSSSSYVLLFDEGVNSFETISWSATDFGFDASVTYTVQLDTIGAGFATAVDLESTQELSADLNIGALNGVLLAYGLVPEESADVQIRIQSSIDGNVEPVYSETLSLSFTPFATDFEPIFLIGAAQGWDLAMAAELKGTGPGTYEGVASFETDGSFRFFAALDWGEAWGFSFFDGGVIPATLGDNGDADSNFIFTGTTGLYLIAIDLNAKTITLTEQNFPSVLYIIGDDQAWSLDDALQLRHLGSGVFEGYETFGTGSSWRFFEAPDWAATQYNFATFVDGSIPSDLTGVIEGDANFTFNGTTGVYKITVSILDLTIEMEAADTPTLYIIGDDQGWSLEGEAMTWVRGEKFTQNAEFNTGSSFRFFEAQDWAAVQYNYNTFFDGTIDSDLSGVTEDDANFTFNGTAGTYDITVDLINLTIDIE